MRDKEKNLGRAINAYMEALKVVDNPEQFPHDYTATQKNLGNSYKSLSEVKDKEANLNKAIDAYNKALMVPRKDALPRNFVETSYNLALTLHIKGDIARAMGVMEEMLPVAEEVGHPELENYHRFYEHLKDRQVE